jgi:hypothetical protein
VAVIAIGVVLAVAGLVLYSDVAGVGGCVIRVVTSRNLGSLAPGYAATRGGFQVYSLLLVAFAVAVTGAGVSPIQPLAGVISVAAGCLAFALLSVLAIAGEIRTFRRLGSPEAQSEQRGKR